jgi:hypothetical protein
MVWAAALGLGGGRAWFQRRRRLGLWAALLSLVGMDAICRGLFFPLEIRLVGAAVFFFPPETVRPVKKRSQLTPALLNGNGM